MCQSNSLKLVGNRSYTRQTNKSRFVPFLCIGIMFSTIPEDGIWPLEKNLFKKADKGGASSLEQELKIEALMPTRTSL